MPPLNLVGDFGGGALYLAFGLLAGVIDARAIRPGPGGRLRDDRRRGLADGDVLRHGRHGHVDRPARVQPARRRRALSTTPTRPQDGSYISLGSIEPQFYALLLEKAGLSDPALQAQMDRADWPALKAKLAAVIKTKTPRRVVRDHGRHRRLLRAGARPRRGAAAIRTTSRARPSSRSTASRSRRPRRASRPPPARSRARRPASAPTRATSSPTGAWRSRPRPDCGPGAGGRCPSLPRLWELSFRLGSGWNGHHRLVDRPPRSPVPRGGGRSIRKKTRSSWRRVAPAARRNPI